MRLEHIQSRVEQQLVLVELIANTFDNATKVGMSHVTSQRINTRMDALNDNWEKLNLNNDAITLAKSVLSQEEKLLLEKHSYFQDNLFTMTHECYLETKEKLSTLLESTPTTMIRSSSTSSMSDSQNTPTIFHHARLPRINLPRFDGSPNDWISFKDLFVSLVVSNPALTSVEKLQYLKTSLTGPAAQMIKNTSLTSDNFQKTWDALISFYENKRLLVNAALHSLINLKRMTKESASEMEQLYTQIMQVYRTLETLQRPVATWDDFLVFIAVQRLDAESVKAWEHHLGSSKEPPTWTQFSEFLITRLFSLQAFEKSRTGKFSSQTPKSSAKAYYQGKSKDTGESSTKQSCPLCSSHHYIASCPQYTGKSTQQRTALLSKYKLCYNCLGHHRVAACKTGKRCQKCGLKHHTTIHKANASISKAEQVTKKDDNAPQQPDAQVHHSITSHKTFNILLATAQVKIISEHGEIATARALVDQGSEISLISERLVQRLKLPRHHSSLSLVGIGAQRANRTNGVTCFKITPHYDSLVTLTISAHILPKLTSSIPSMKSEKTSWPHLKGITLADPDFTTPQSIDIILGADSYNQIIEDGLIKEAADQLIAQLTKLGWIVSGPTSSNRAPNAVGGYHVSVDQELYNLLHRFWELDSVPTSTSSQLSPEEQDCEKQFTTTVSRDDTGRYTVRLPFKQSTEKLGDSKAKARRVMTQLSTKLALNTEFAQSYKQFMNDYEKLHHMQRVPYSQSEPIRSYYLPHHGVWRESSLTTKLRVVFNGSSRTTSGLSLNDLLHTGAKLQTDLVNVLLWFRLSRYVFATDVEKMYRQIRVHPDDWDYQRIIWTDRTNHLSTYCLTTVTYGLACAPYLALRTVEQLLKDEGEKFPLAVPTLTKGRYVDDLFGGSDSIDEAKKLVMQLQQLCMAGGFPLQKWISNHQEILASVPSDKQIPTTSLQIDETFKVNALGLI